LSEHTAVEETLYEKLWRGAVMAQAKGQMQRNWAEEWAEQATKQQHWALVARAAMTLRQLVPQGGSDWKKYSFMMITAQWLASRAITDPNGGAGDERMKTLNATLAVRQLDYAVKSMEETEQNVGNNPSSTIRTQSD